MFSSENSTPSIHLQFPNPWKSHNSDLLINLCRCGKSACNRDWWNFSPWFLLGPRKSTNRPLRTALMEFRTPGNACRPPHAEMVSVTGRERHWGERCKRYFTKLDTISSLFTHPQQRLDLKIFKKEKKKGFSKHWSNCRLMKKKHQTIILACVFISVSVRAEPHVSASPRSSSIHVSVYGYQCCESRVEVLSHAFRTQDLFLLPFSRNISRGIICFSLFPGALFTGWERVLVPIN